MCKIRHGVVSCRTTASKQEATRRQRQDLGRTCRRGQICAVKRRDFPRSQWRTGKHTGRAGGIISAEDDRLRASRHRAAVDP